MTELRASLRLQFHRHFTLDDAYKLVPYFSRLGISHIYASPILKARAGSMHGYDIVDPTCVNPELGGEAALERLVAALRAENMGFIVDFVPNHMAVGGDSNPWWLDVLEWGVASPYAHFFDIQWNSHDPLMKGQLLVPFLRTDYGEVLSAGEITLHFDADSGSFFAAHYDHRFPIFPPSYGEILRNTSEDKLLSLVRPFEALERSSHQWAEAQELRAELRDIAREPAMTEAMQTALARYNATEHDGLQRLHRLLELQHYRIASWRTAADDINWRRFFDINDLGALRVERPDVFNAIHAKIFELIGKGLIDGLRIDHIDGLANPRGYCRKLRRQLDRLQLHRPQLHPAQLNSAQLHPSQLHPSQLQRPGEPAGDRLPIFVEKILADGEKLPADWQVDGTTGYDFMNQVSLLQHDPMGEFQLYGLWARVSGRRDSFLEEVREARKQILASSLVGDFEMIAQGLLLIARKDLNTRDLTLGAIRRALFELIVHFTVYRTYAGACGRSTQDQHFFAQALADARTTLAESDWPLLDHLDRWLGGQPLREVPFGAERKLRKQILTRFQQLTSPTAAKAVEDTACYRSAALLSRNDVGFDPQHFSAPLADFHQNCETRAEYFPHGMLTTATHDHKRGEDTRARLAVLSERSVWFGEKIEQWHTQANNLRSELEDGVAPSPGDELMLYQILLGTWPLHLAIEDKSGLQEYLDRLLRWQEKSIREAKLRTNWSAPNEPYERACREFLTQLLQSTATLELRRDIATAAMMIAPAGALNSLTQTLLRMTAPGFPDLYQGTEFWDFSLVDPDNRSPVDFDKREVALAIDPSAEDLIENWRDGRIKQWLIARTLNRRRQYSALFRDGSYEPLLVEGEHADRVVAFVRHYGDVYVFIIAPRLTANLLGNGATPHVQPEHWGETCVVLPIAIQQRRAEGLLFARRIESTNGRMAVRELLRDFPVNILCFTSSYVLHPEQENRS